MKALATALTLSLCFCGAAYADNKPMTPQQSKMADCNKQAAGMKGADRKAAMKSCLSGDAAAATPAAPAAPAAAPATPATPAVPAASSQQNKMADCNKQATGMKGADRKAFMKTCLSGSTSSAAPAMPAAAPAAPAAPATPSAAAVDKNGKPLTAQQMKMKECSAANKGKKGDDYKKAQSECLKK
jgi:hypothetical protein